MTFGFLLGGTLFMLQQDGKLADREVWKELADVLVGKYRVIQDAARLFVHYARADYSPEDVDYSQLALRVLAPQVA